MGFKYVLIPASATDAMQELEFESDVLDLSQDKFREHVEKHFQNLGASVDRGMLLGQLQERTGMDLVEKQASGELSSAAMDKLLAHTGVEIFPVLLPTKDTEFWAISFYCDDKSVSKGLEENARASGLVQACGFPGQTFRGDVFVGRVFDDTEDEWKRADFTLADCSTDSKWAALARKQRANRSSGDVASLAAKMGVNNPAQINPGMLQDSQPTGETDQYVWRQCGDEVEITFKKDGLVKGDKQQVKVTFARQSLKVVVKGDVLFDAKLCEPIHPDEATWTLSDGVLQVTLSKAEANSWPALTKG
jgi:hypothetical protein